MRAWFLFLIPAILSLATPLQAKVFWRTPATLPDSWTRAYQSPVKLQEGEGELEVFGSSDSLRQIEARLKDQHGDNLAWMPGENVAWAMAIEQGRLYRYLVQPRPHGEGFWVMVVEQRLAEAGKPGQKPQQHQLKEVPAYPASQPSFYNFTEENQTAIEVSVHPGEPGAILEGLSMQLEADGWNASPTNTGGFRMFIKRDEVAVISANRSKDGLSRIVRLHKRLGVK